jgi:hypothetical protein
MAICRAPVGAVVDDASYPLTAGTPLGRRAPKALRMATRRCQTVTPVMGKLNSPPIECSSRLCGAATFDAASAILGLPA